MIPLAQSGGGAGSDVAGELIVGWMVIIGLLYFLPSVIAFSRHHSNAGGILLLNLLLGWTVIAWIASLLWSFTNDRQETVAAAPAAGLAAALFCRNCGKYTPAGSRFCTGCGSAL